MKRAIISSRTVFCTLSLIFLSSFINASVYLSPSKLYFDMKNNKEDCQTITFISDDYQGNIIIRDVWADIKEDSNINNFNMRSNDFGIYITYDSAIKNFEESEEIEICLTGKNVKNGKGALIFTPESETNVIVETGAWIFVKGEDYEVSEENTERKNEEEDIDIQRNSRITGGVIGVWGREIHYKNIIIALLVIIILGILIHNKLNKGKLKERKINK